MPEKKGDEFGELEDVFGKNPGGEPIRRYPKGEIVGRRPIRPLAEILAPLFEEGAVTTPPAVPAEIVKEIEDYDPE